MDWRYLLRLNPEDLSEENKDQLLNTVAWYDCDEDGELDLGRCKSLLRIGQEIMKYKSEQVEALLAELDEIAVKQGEEEAKRQESDYDARSMKSKASGGADNEDIVNKYRDLKLKYKKLQRMVEKTNEENDKLKQNVKMLEKERVHLQNELQHSHQDESASDISETVKDQHRDLIDNVCQKNAQISQLLTDIENVESDNLLLRKKLTTVRDELEDATENLVFLNSEGKVSKVKLQEMSETLEGLRFENEGLKSQVDEITEDRKQRELEFDEFAVEVDMRVEEWKKVLDEKNRELATLKSSQTSSPTALSQSTSSLTTKEPDQSQLNLMQKTIEDREVQIMELRSELQTATSEMEENTEIVKKLAAERDGHQKKCEKLSVVAKDLKKQLKSMHDRCQELQEEVAYHESLLQMKSADFQELFDRIENGEQITDKETLVQLHEVKSQKRLKEKQINDLARSCNKLQGAVDVFEKENLTLRERLGLNEDDYVSTRSAYSLQRKQRKHIEELQREMRGYDEERLEFRMEVQKLSKIISSLSDQIIELGETPNPEHDAPGKPAEVVENPPIPAKRNLPKSITMQEKNVQIQKSLDETDDDTKDRYKVVVEENEALRKGLHEILDSVHAKQETTIKEIKSETLENLLRALDVKHISGWYHPAMRLQAELHALQGSNNELREQLRSTREQLETYREKFPQSLLESLESDTNQSSALVIAKLNKHLLNVLQTYNNEEEINTNLLEKLQHYKNEFTIIHAQVVLLYKQYYEEKNQWRTELDLLTITNRRNEEQSAILDAKIATIAEYLDPKTDDDHKMKRAADASAQLVVLNRKCVYLENQEADYRKRIAELKEDLLDSEAATVSSIHKLGEDNAILAAKLGTRDAKVNLESEELVRVRDQCDGLVAHERALLSDLSEIRKVNENEMNLLMRRVELLQDEKSELEKRLFESYPGSLGQAEVNLIAERQRANHTNNLYELVKEQLHKSEERYKEYQKVNNEVIRKNLSLQESLKKLENKIVNYVDVDIFRDLENQYLDALKTQESLIGDRVKLENELTKVRKCNETRRLWVDLERQEFLSLKHQIVDLQAIGEDKSVIARLSSDVVNSRMGEAETRRKYEEALLELAKYCSEKTARDEGFEKEKNHQRKVREGLERKIGHLEIIIRQQRQHYIGYIPLVSEYNFSERIREIYAAKKAAYEHLEKAQEIKNDCDLLKDTWEAKNNILNELNALIENQDERAKIMEKWFQDKISVQLQELRYKKQAEFKDSQLQQMKYRVAKQEQHISSMELELLESICIREDGTESEKPVRDLRKTTATVVEIKPLELRSFKTVETQTITSSPRESSVSLDQTVQSMIKNLEVELSKSREESETKTEMVQTMKQRISELEMSISLFRQQIGDKQSQITFYEKHIMEMQHKKGEQSDDSAIGNSETVTENTTILKNTIKELQEAISSKENAILKYQSLIKKDRDEHSLAAARFQDEIKELQAILSRQKDNVDVHQNCQMVEPHPSRAAIEHYIAQVHALEKHTSELHTNVASLNSQLQASRQEAVRWRSLAYDRLQNMEELRVSIEEQHHSELTAYKNESEKWREEVMSLQQFISKYKKDITELRPDIEKEIKDKDNKIHELTVTLRQLRNNLRKKPATSQPTSSREENFEETKENLVREHDVLKKRFEQLLNREKNAREEIRTLKGQLMRRPLLSARSENNTNSKEHQLQKKLSTQEKEIDELKEKLEHEASLNEAHRTKVSEDFERWSKLKFWQQNAEKLKVKLKGKHDELEKSLQTCTAYRMLIERLEREKHNLENRVKNLKTNTTNVQVARHDMLEIENGKLLLENENLRGRLEVQQRHSAGGLGTAMLQEKLEAQERKIAILEMSAKGGGELRSELERQQASTVVLKKSNLRLEAENLELRLDLEKSCKELPHLREQILHLESYIEVLKTEKEHHEVSNCGDHAPPPEATANKRVPELERTVFVLKRIVEKLQVENKRLQGGSRPCSDRVGSAERIKREHRRLKEQHADCAKKIAELEAATKCTQQHADVDELKGLSNQLKHKSELLDRVKVLLQKAAVKEKALLEQVTTLKSMIPCDCARQVLPETS